MRGGAHNSRFLAPALFIAIGALTAATLLITQELRRATDIVNTVKIKPSQIDADTSRIAVSFNLTRADTNVHIDVVDRRDRLVRTLLDGGSLRTGRRKVGWNLRDQAGDKVDEGLYRVRVILGEQDRMVVLPPGIRVPQLEPDPPPTDRKQR